ncbi:hypothetical protein LTR91_008938 [Friedmanniomyces endolithicus]|uniref:Uncharacterized protein n=1 Tax=Friedmanniomyces endolithicus TaxID=329885 RepID=A0AAN6QU40_9PEZI|nr:hypothetical protein LTR91_008938 [Friedmanniomyces endolithicus]KAK0996793.1 hypothetical protein LTS01_006245 [Friedmanniomyces endolithicus]KAK1031097.1 hypothetical protein LTS16_018320 [Friedmanniomyces endolithicus]
MARPSPSAGNQTPVSFKTVPGRNRTQKWQQAKTYNYDGDDWGGYDPNDEYGSYDEPESAHSPAPAPALPSHAQQRPQRQASFDTGDDGARRQYSGSNSILQRGYAADERRGSPSVMSGGGNTRPSGDYARAPHSRGSNDNDYDRRARERNFTNPEQVPPPLNTHSSPVRGPQTAGAYPPRKSSTGQSSTSSGRSGAPEPMSAPPAPAGKSMDKPLPFIRPSDIYKRMQEAREREGKSMDGSRPSVDGIQRSAPAGVSPPSSAVGMAVPADNQGFSTDHRPSPELVVERRELEQRPHDMSLPAVPGSRPSTSDTTSGPAADMQQEAEYQPLSSLRNTGSESLEEPRGYASGQQASPVLPPVNRFSGFGSGFGHGTTAENRLSSSDGVTTSTPPSPVHVQSTIARVLGAPLMQAAGGTQESAGTTPYTATSQYPSAPSSDLQHQPSGASTGFRSVVHTAFDRRSDSSSMPVSPISRDEASSHSVDGHGGSSVGVSRSDTTSTAGISPIMSRVPPAASTQPPNLQQEWSVPPPIAEEPASARTPTQSRHTSGNYQPPGTPQSQQQPNIIARKPSPSLNTPSHSRNVSAAENPPSTLVQPGYRRSLDPPSNGSSPARTPGLENSTTDERLGAPLMADLGHAEKPDVADQAAEVVDAHLEPVETPAVEREEERFGERGENVSPHRAGVVGADGRGDSGAARAVDPSSPERTPYSPQRGGGYNTREADPSRSANASPPYSPNTAQRGGDYSSREADLARSVNSSPQKSAYSPAVAEAEAASQQLFLRTHTGSLGSQGSPGSPSFARPVSPGIARAITPVAAGMTAAGVGGAVGGGESPATKGRVREIAEKYTSLDDASRRNSAVSVMSSKSSWSRFGGSEENLGLKRKGTGGSGSLLAGEGLGGYGGGREEEDERDEVGRTREAPTQQMLGGGLVPPPPMGARPGVESAMSFRPHLPGEWVSFANTPATEHPPGLSADSAQRSFDEEQQHYDHAGSSSPLTPRASQIAVQEEEEPVDLTPTRKETRGFSREYKPLPLAPHHDITSSAQRQDDEPVDLTPTTRKTQLQSRDASASHDQPAEHVSTALAQQVKDVGSAIGASLMSIGGLATQARDFGSSAPAAPVKQPEMASKTPYGYVSSLSRPVVPREESAMSVMTEGTMSVGSEAPPTLEGRDSWEEEDEEEEREAGKLGPRGGAPRPMSSYFSGAVPPLRTAGAGVYAAREAIAEEPSQQRERPDFLPMLSTDTGAEDLESDRLRKEIVRSLDPGKREQMNRESIMEIEGEEQEEDVQRTQDALDAPENMRRVEHGEKALPAAEALPAGVHGGKVQNLEKPLPMMLDQRFSWENRTPAQRAMIPPTAMLEPPVMPEVAPEAPYERPHSRNLHVMNPVDDAEDSEEAEEEEKQLPRDKGHMMESQPVSAVSGGSLGMLSLVSPLSMSQDSAAAHERGQEASLGPMMGPSAVPREEEQEDLRQGPLAEESEAREPSETSKVENAPDSLGTADDALPQYQKEFPVAPPTAASPTIAAPKITSQTPPTRVPPFREILAIKSTPDRIDAYNSTRQTFAEMDTGLQGWLAGMLATYPEHAGTLHSGLGAGSAPGGLRASSGTFKHRTSPSIIKFTKNLASGSGGGSGMGGPSEAAIRKASVGLGGVGGGEMGEDVTPSRSRTGLQSGGGGGGDMDVEKMQQKGKELMKSVGGGAKGLFQRGKSRFGRSDKASTPPPPSSKPSSKLSSTASTPPPSRSPFQPATNASSASSLRFTGAGASSNSQSSATPPIVPISRFAAPRPGSSGTPPIASSPRLPLRPEPSATPPIPSSRFPSYPAASTQPTISRPPSRPQTPSSSNRPLSQAFARLRERSRSISTSRSKSIKSRPASLVLTNPELVLDEEDKRRFQAAATAGAASASPGPARREVWEADDGAGLAGLAEEKGGREEVDTHGGEVTPGRLGVLPSPGVDTFSTSLRDSPVKKVDVAEDLTAMKGGEEIEGRDDLPGVKGARATDEGLHGTRSRPVEVPPTPTRDHSEVKEAEPATQEQSQDAGPSPSGSPSTPTTAYRPPHDRKVSALASLPSQQRARELNSPQSPGSTIQATLNDNDGEVDELYARTPVASAAVTPWSGERQRTKRLASSRGRTLSPVASSSPNHAAGYESSQPLPAGGKADDQRSEVSAEEDKGVAEGTKMPDDDVEAHSRRSSISSLGSPDTVVGQRVSRVLGDREAGQDATPLYTARMKADSAAIPDAAVGVERSAPAGYQIVRPSLQPSEFAHDTTPLPQHDFMDRPYRGRIVQPDHRTLSYMPLGSDGNGVPVQEALETADEPLQSVDLSGYGGPPAGTPPLSHHPLTRNSGYVQASEYEMLRSSPVGTITPSARHNRQVSGEASRRSSLRRSAFFRGPDAPVDTMPGAPAPYAMTPSYGLEDLDTTGAEAVLNSQTEEKPDKRRSGMWDAFKRSPSVSRTQFSRDSSVLALDSRTEAGTDQTIPAMSRVGDGSAQSRLLKPQRAASAATPPTEPTKKKRFSGLGSLFGRSSTQGRNATNPKKLTKTQPPTRESSVRPGTASRPTVREGYEAYETARRQQMPNLSQRSPGQPWSAPPSQPAPVNIDPHFANVSRSLPQGDTQTRPEEWHTATADQSPANQGPYAPPLTHIQRPESRHQYRSLHSAAFQQGLQQARIPEAFRPVEASYGKQAEPIGPPAEYRSPVTYRPSQPSRQPTLPTQQSYWNTASPVPDQGVAPMVAIQPQAYDGQATTLLQGSSRADQGSWGQRINTTMSPVPGSPPGTYPSPHMSPSQEHRVTSLGEEMARSPAQHYADQQTPWAIDVPRPGGDPRQTSRAPSWSTVPNTRQDPAGYPGARNTQPAPGDYAPRHMLPMYPQSPENRAPYGYPIADHSQPHEQAAMYPDLYARGPTSGHEASRYPSSPYTPQSPVNYGAGGGGYGQPPVPYNPGYEKRYASPEQQQPPMQQRYHAPPRQPYLPHEGRAMSYQRTPSGFSGRRDDAAVGEEEMFGGMKGASYPGQEWAPRI